MVSSMLNEALYSQVRRNYGFSTTFSSKEKAGETSQEPVVEKKSGILKRAILPVCVMGSGALLIYHGFKKPALPDKLNGLYRKKISEMTGEVANFKTLAAEHFEKEYQKIIPYIKNYKEDRAFEYLPYATNIQDAKTGSEMLGIIDNAFSVMKEIRTKDVKAGVSGMDEFRKYMYQVNHPAYQYLTQIRQGTSLKILDISLMPRFKSGEQLEDILKFEEKLGKVKGIADKRMFDVQNNLTDSHMQQASAQMAKEILGSRKELHSSAEIIIDTAFMKFAKMYNLGNDFRPLFMKGKNPTEAFETLTQKSRKPQALSQEIIDIINNDYLTKVLEITDFNKLDDKTIKSLFEWMPFNFDTRQMDMITDRIRLQQAVNKAEGLAENQELKTVAAKLETLSAKLEDYGKADLIKRCSQDLSDMNQQQLHAKLYYVNSTARKIGLDSLEDTDKFMHDISPEYVDSSFKHHIKTFLNHPEHYFM